jgi:hypothetical protein
LPTNVRIESICQPTHLTIRRLCVVIEVRFNADSLRGYAGVVKSLSHHVNHFAVSNQMKVARLQILFVDPGWDTIGDASGQASPFF